MRLWSLHPKYLDTKGLVALWREALLAKRVLEEKTKGYRFHPQLERFRATDDQVTAINSYLLPIWQEAQRRGYRFDKEKIGEIGDVEMTVTDGQLGHELVHLRKKLVRRDPPRLDQLLFRRPDPHPLFRIVGGGVEPWERVSDDRGK
ncbi:MAG TPA: pyrimidine dimer DNA glycosylase/endonuclease V [Candidatus Paceibacterota bacterium]|nr:pyrimidine dimer DNA glycosylase/endonuclease V [Candidatus Paceibacterota bacterium]